MADIVNRNQLYKRLATKNSQEVEVAVNQINRILEKCEKFPTNVAANLFGESVVTREAVKKKMEAAGWSVRIEYDSRDGDFFIVQ